MFFFPYLDIIHLDRLHHHLLVCPLNNTQQGRRWTDQGYKSVRQLNKQKTFNIFSPGIFQVMKFRAALNGNFLWLK